MSRHYLMRMTADDARRVSAARAQESFPLLADILNGCCLYAGVTMDEVCGTGRHPKVVAARRAFAALCKEMPLSVLKWRPSFPQIAQVMGEPNHSSTITQYRMVYADPIAHKIVDMVCEEYGIPGNERPAWLTLAPLEMRRTAMQPPKDEE